VGQVTATIELHDSVIGAGPDVVLLHGLFGMGSNLGSIARDLQNRFRVHMVDLPDHGGSAWLPESTIEAMAEAVRDWMDSREVTRAHLLGHSLGGKVAMKIALEEPAMVDRLVVADIAPVAYPRSHDAVFAGLHAVSAARCENRQQAREVLRTQISEDAVVQFLLLSLYAGDDGILHWRFNVDGLEAGYAGLLGPVESDESFPGDALFIYGEQSAYTPAAFRDEIASLFPAAQFHGIADAGHWLHAEKPREFNAAVGKFLDD
jgi:esterase